ncbi:MAG: LysM peptidoglycan-binding domain-containing protein [Planctomycetes bacterium]|nr:LysM peptidoglycan-binding domain-containing protein [Planctomycetota bacterium]MCC7170087.1 LysM peptidoglycan-binding domain-containing protein [Planctomycetota bacterium]
MGELEKYGLLSAALLLLMAGLLAFFGRDSESDPGAHALSANNEVVERDSDRGTPSRDPGSGPRVTPKPQPTNEGPAQTPRENENNAGGDDVEPRVPSGRDPGADEDAARGSAPAEQHPPKVQDPPESDAPIHYAVKKGDTLSSIAAAHFGDKKYYTLIQQANPGVDARKLTVGQELILPAKSATRAPADAAKTPASGTTGGPLKDTKSTKGPAGKALEAAKDAKPTTSGAKAPVVADRPSSDKPKVDGSPRKSSKDGEKSNDAATKKGPREHRVAKGDTLTSIARKYYADANKWKTIFEANRDKLKSTSIVPEGVVLKIP